MTGVVRWVGALRRCGGALSMHAALSGAEVGQHESSSPHGWGLPPSQLMHVRMGQPYSQHGPQPSRCFSTSSISLSLQAGIVGMPNVGKSTLFNALVENGKAQAANFPFCTIEPNKGIVTVPDPRMEVLSKISGSKQLIPTTVEFVDIAGLVKGASRGEGLGNKFLSNIRDTDAIVHVVRCFEDINVVHVNGKVDPVDDIETINIELALADLDTVGRRLERLAKAKKSKEEQDKVEKERSALMKISIELEAGRNARLAALEPDELAALKGSGLLTMKPMIFAANVAEDELANKGADNKFLKLVQEKADSMQCELVVVSARVESELMQLAKAEAKEWLEMLGVKDGGLSNLIRATYKALGLQTYFTTGEKETRAWTIVKGMNACQAAGVIHSDFEKGFIRAETIAYDDYVRFKGDSGAKEAGRMRLEGKEYIVQEGDVMRFRFSV